MYQEHFQKELYSEILSGLLESFKDLKVEAELLVKSATEIYLSSKDAAEQADAGETDFLQIDHERRTVTSVGVLECESCGRKMAKFVGDSMSFCPGCGKAVRRGNE